MTQGKNHPPNSPVGSWRLRVADLVVDLDRSSVVRDGRVIDLPDLSFRLLAVLIRQAPERVDKDQLIAEVWDSQRIVNLAAANFYAEQRDEALKLLSELEAKAKGEYVSPAVFATLHFSAGKPDEAFEKLNESLAQRDRELIFLPVSLSPANYRDDSRYEELIRKIGFEM